MRDVDIPIQGALLRGLPALVGELGASGEKFLATYGLDATATSNTGSYISLHLLERILEDAARQFEVFDFGLRMAARQDLEILGPLAVAMENSRTISEALACASRFLHVFSPAFSHAVIADPLENPGMLGIRFASSTTTREAPQLIDYGVGLVHRVVVLLNGGGPYGLRSVQLPHSRLAAEGAYRDYFGAAVAFECEAAVLRVPRQVMDVPIVGRNDLLRDIAIDFLESRFSQPVVPVSELVSTILAGHWGPDPPDLAKVARLLEMHPRAVQRKLAAEGARFKGLVDRVRRQQALDLITTTRLGFSDVAARLGMTEQSSLTHAVQRWFGVSPSVLRSAGPADEGD